MEGTRARRRGGIVVVVIAVICALGSGARDALAAQWRDIGPDGGAVLDVVIAPSNPSLLYAATNGGVFVSHDGGHTWVGPGPGLDGAQPVAIAVDPRAPAIAYAATPLGLFRSRNAGGSWQATGPWRAVPAGCVATAPQGRSIAYVVIPRLPRSAQLDFYRSTDRGASWHRRGTLPLALPDTCSSLWVDPTNHDHLVAATTRGMFTSRDGGGSWTSARGVPRAVAVSAVDASPARPRVLYAAIGSIVSPAVSAVVFRSTDGGRRFAPAASGLPVAAVLALLVDPRDPDVVLVSLAQRGLFRSEDGGATWDAVGSPGSFVQSLVAQPNLQRTYYAGMGPLGTNGPGLFVTADGADTWAPSSQGIGATWVTDLAVTGLGSLYAAVNEAGVQRRMPGGEWERVLGDGTVATVADSVATVPDDPQRVYASNRAGTWRSDDDGETWTRLGEEIDRLAVDPTDPQRLFGMRVASIVRSSDGGMTWSTALDTPSLGFVIGAQGRLYAVCPATPGPGPHVERLELLRSDDHGATWQVVRADVAGFLDLVGLDAFDDRIVFTSTPSTHLERSADGGVHWSEVGAGLDHAATRLWSDSITAGRLHVATTSGHVFTSSDDGDTFVEEGGAQPTSFVVDLVGDADRGRLYAATIASGVWELGIEP